MNNHLRSVSEWHFAAFGVNTSSSEENNGYRRNADGSVSLWSLHNRWKPTVAVSPYHKPNDVMTIPPLVLSLAEDYTLYIRHYSNSMAETVLYAIPEGRRIRRQEDRPWTSG